MRKSTKRPPTQHDLALAAGVSQITVSRTFSGHPSVRTEVRERVMREAARLGYRLNRSANIMRSGRHRAVGLLASDNQSTSSTPIGFIWALEDACYTRGLQLMIGRYPEKVINDPVRLPQFLKNWMVDGVLIYHTHNIPQGLPVIFEQMNLPFVWVNSNHPEGIKSADEEASSFLVSHLAALGHKRIAYMDHTHEHETSAPHYSTAARKSGYVNGMKKAHLDPFEVTIPSHSNLPLHMRVEEWIETQKVLPTAFVTPSRWLAMAVVLAMKAKGLKTPNDYSITTIDQSGFNNLGLNITIQRIPNAGMANTAIDRLETLIDGDEPSMPENVPFEFDSGKSCAFPPRN